MNVDVHVQIQGSSSAPKPHDHLWYSDGNVVLATETFLFKVYRGILSRQSTVFRDMFEFPAGEGTGRGTSDVGQTHEMHEGLPLVRLVGDKGEDVAHLLRAVNEHHYFHRDDSDTPLKTIIALLTLSTKYDFADLRKDVILLISKHYPMSLQECDEIDTESSPMFQEDRVDCHVPLLMAVFTCDVDFLLPILYFSCTNITVKQLFAAAYSGSMNPDLLRTLMIGREALVTRFSRLVADLPEDLMALQEVEDIGCRTATNGTCLRTARFENISTIVGTMFYETQPDVLIYEHLSGSCVQCRSFVVKSIEDDRKKIWEDIPFMFDCPGWDIVQQKLKDVIASLA